MTSRTDAHSGFTADNYHFIGIGGIGMSALARLLVEKGCSVSGSDVQSSRLTNTLESMGARIVRGHGASNIHGRPVVVYSSAISETNPELVEARRLGLRTIRRAELLAEFFNVKKGIAISGTHGKTTTTAMTTLILRHAGLDPDAFIGGEVESLGGNVIAGSGEFVVAEADESDGSLIHLEPLYTIATNIEGEHFGFFKDLGSIIDLFRKFLGQTHPGGKIYLNADNHHLRELLDGHSGAKCSYGLDNSADIFAHDIHLRSFGSTFKVTYNGCPLGEMSLSIPGIHNVSNSLGPIALATDLGIGFNTIREGLEGFKGAGRRFEVRAVVDGITIIDDYAHHPTEIAATIASAKTIEGANRIIGVFQPHRFSRTLHLQTDFPPAFAGLDELILTEIYPAGEEPIEGIDGRTILDRVVRQGLSRVEYFEDMNRIPSYLAETLQNGDVVLLMGAGNINSITDIIATKLKERAASV